MDDRLNDYAKVYQDLKAADAQLESIITATKRYSATAKSGLEKLSKDVASISEELEKLGVNGAKCKAPITRMKNSVKWALQGDPLRAYSFLDKERPLSLFPKVIQTLLKAAGAGSAIVKPTLVANKLKDLIGDSYTTVTEACDNWRSFVAKAGREAYDLVSEARVQPLSHSSGFTETDEWKDYAKAQREFAEEHKSYVDSLTHYLLGLENASSAFADCYDTDIALKTMTWAMNSLLKLHEAFGKKWGDVRVKMVLPEQRNLFASAVSFEDRCLAHNVVEKLAKVSGGSTVVVGMDTGKVEKTTKPFLHGRWKRNGGTVGLQVYTAVGDDGREYFLFIEREMVYAKDGRLRDPSKTRLLQKASVGLTKHLFDNPTIFIKMVAVGESKEQAARDKFRAAVKKQFGVDVI